MTSHSQTTTLSVKGMTCNSCVNAIESQLKPLPGVLSASVSLLDEKATVTFDPSLQTVATIKETIEDCGFDVAVLSGGGVSASAAAKQDSAFLAEWDPLSEKVGAADEGWGGVVEEKDLRISVKGMTCQVGFAIANEVFFVLALTNCTFAVMRKCCNSSAQIFAWSGFSLCRFG